MTDNVTPFPTKRRTSDLVTEDSAAQEFARQYHEQLQFDHTAAVWYEWTGKRWQKSQTGKAFQWARELARDLAEKEPDRIRYAASKTAFAKGVERFARYDQKMAITSEVWDRDPYLLGTPDGTVDLKTGDLFDADPRDAITKLTAIAPAKQLSCPRWLKFLEDTTGSDTALTRFLQQFVGYSLTGDTKEHALVFGHGSGGNGKSVFVNTIARILGDYSTTAAMDTFAATIGSKHSTDLAMLRGARLVTASETEEGRAWAEAKIKQLTGGDAVTARFMRQDNFTFLPTFKLLIVGNHRPVLRNVDEAAKRRFNIVPFTRRPAHPDHDLEAKLRDEWPGILRWAIDGCLDWQANGLIRPAVVREATSDYFASQDILGQFLEEACTFEPGNIARTVASRDLFQAWTAYAKAAGEPVQSQKSFGELIEQRGAERCRTNSSRGYRGISLKGDA